MARKSAQWVHVMSQTFDICAIRSAIDGAAVIQDVIAAKRWRLRRCLPTVGILSVGSPRRTWTMRKRLCLPPWVETPGQTRGHLRCETRCERRFSIGEHKRNQSRTYVD